MFETSRRRLWLLSTAILLIVILVVDTAVWRLACRRLEDGARDTMASAGWALATGPSRWGGWPVAAEIVLPDTVLRAGPDIIPPLTWTAEQTSLRLSIVRPTVLTVSAAGAQSLAVGAAPPVPFTAHTLQATIDLAAPGPVRIGATTLAIAAPDGPVGIASADLLVRPDGIAADLAGIGLPGRAGQPIEPRIDRLQLEGRLTVPVEPRPSATESARLWRANGGALTLDATSLRWGSLDATAHATLTLDPALQPAIAGQVTATGLSAVIEQLVQTGAMPRSTATAAQAMLTILAAPTHGGPVTLPVTLQAGIVGVARIPLLRLAPLRWD